MDGRIAQLISKAEHFIAQQDYEQAEACIAAAEQIEPDNRSVRMLKDLLSTLQSQSQKRTLFMRFIPRTMRKQPPNVVAVKSLSSGEVRKRIVGLTGTAEYLLKRGSVKGAYESMMRASALDPTAPEVVACERLVLPLWKRLNTERSLVEATIPATKLPSPPKKIQSTLLERLRDGKLLD